MQAPLASQLERSIDAVSSLRGDMSTIVAICDHLISVLGEGGTIYTAGNGGSATHALHLAEELIGRYRSNRRPLRAVCLNADPTVLTCIANDFGFDQIFARQCEALLGPNDALCVFSTSGASPNILGALDVAHARGTSRIGFLGRDGGKAIGRCDHVICIRSADSAAIQDAHHVALHLVCEAIEKAFSMDG